MSRAARFALTVVAAGAGTWLLGWWAIPIVAVIVGAFGTSSLIAAGACAASWALLLGASMIAGEFGRLGSLLAGIMGLPMAALVVATLLFPALLGWSAASIGNAARTLRPTSRQPS